MSEHDDDQSRRTGRHAGGRLRRRRERLEVSQARLGRAIRTSGLQVRKAERDARPLSAAKLWALAEVLDSPGLVFDGLGIDHGWSSTGKAGDWTCALVKLQSPLLRRRVLQLLQAMAADD